MFGHTDKFLKYNVVFETVAMAAEHQNSPLHFVSVDCTVEHELCTQHFSMKHLPAVVVGSKAQFGGRDYGKDLERMHAGIEGPDPEALSSFISEKSNVLVNVRDNANVAETSRILHNK